MPAHALIQRIINTPDRATATPELDAVCVRTPQFYFEYPGNAWAAQRITLISQVGQTTEAEWFAALRVSRYAFTTELFGNTPPDAPTYMSDTYLDGFRNTLNSWFYDTLRPNIDPRIITWAWDWEGVDLDRIGLEYARFISVVSILGREHSNFHWGFEDSVEPRYIFEVPIRIPTVPCYLTFAVDSGYTQSKILQMMADNPGAIVYLADPWIHGGASAWGTLLDAILAANPRMVLLFPTTGIDGVTLPEGETRATQDAIILAKLEALTAAP